MLTDKEIAGAGVDQLVDALLVARDFLQAIQESDPGPAYYQAKTALERITEIIRESTNAE